MGPARTYYEHCVGGWRCRLGLRVTDAAALRAAMGWSDRVGVHLASRWPAWLPALWFDTSVRCEADGSVVHTTTVRWLGLPLVDSTERITLDADGCGLTLEGAARVLAAPWRARAVSGRGRVDDDAAHASYDLVWLGAPLRQTTVRTADVVTLTMTGAGFSGVQALQRRR